MLTVKFLKQTTVIVSPRRDFPCSPHASYPCLNGSASRRTRAWAWTSSRKATPPLTCAAPLSRYSFSVTIFSCRSTWVSLIGPVHSCVHSLSVRSGSLTSARVFPWAKHGPTQ